jgi:hypothetical protein
MRKKRKNSNKSQNIKFWFFSLSACLIFAPFILLHVLSRGEPGDSQDHRQISSHPQFPTIPNRQISSQNSGNLGSNQDDTSTPPDVHEALKKIQDPFQNDPILTMRETKPDPDGNFGRVKVLNTSFKYPHVRVKETLIKDFSTGEDRVLARIAMVADHVIVALEPEYTEADLTQFLRGLGYEIRKAKPISQTYLISFDGQDVDALDKAIAALKKSKMINTVEPDYILYGN